MTISKSFCIMPWSGISTEASGGYRPCCWMDGTHLYRGSIDDYETSDYLSEMKQDFLEGRYPDTCSRCKWNDENNMVSKRQRENKKWLEKNNIEDYATTDYSIIDLRLNNKCNLLCVSCGPKSSSAIFEEVEQNQDKHLTHYKLIYNKVKDMNLSTPYSDEEVDKLIERINPTSRVYFTGGEPTLVKPAFRVLEKMLEKGYNKDVPIEFNSNFQALNKKWIEQLKQFKGLMMPSIDAVGSQAELIRYGSKWQDVDYNFRYFFKECTGFRIKIWPTISILNILYIKNIIEWADSFESDRIEISLDNRLSAPAWLDIKNMPDSLKDKAREYLSGDPRFLDILRHLNEVANVNEQKNFITNMDKLDAIRNTNWRETLNEIANGWE
jgi:sulfatase maturation enzyme AslB (radical SAM superfamily)